MAGAAARRLWCRKHQPSHPRPNHMNRPAARTHSKCSGNGNGRKHWLPRTSSTVEEEPEWWNKPLNGLTKQSGKDPPRRTASAVSAVPDGGERDDTCAGRRIETCEAGGSKTSHLLLLVISCHFSHSAALLFLRRVGCCLIELHTNKSESCCLIITSLAQIDRLRLRRRHRLLLLEHVCEKPLYYLGCCLRPRPGFMRTSSTPDALGLALAWPSAWFWQDRDFCVTQSSNNQLSGAWF